LTGLQVEGYYKMGKDIRKKKWKDNKANVKRLPTGNRRAPEQSQVKDETKKKMKEEHENSKTKERERRQQSETNGSKEDNAPQSFLRSSG